MTISNSGLYCANWRDALSLSSPIIMNLDSETALKCAMFTDTLSPNFNGNGDTSFSAAPFTSNQVTGTGYTAGGAVLTSTTFTDVGNVGTLVFDAADVAWSSSTIANAMGAVIYNDSQTTPVAKPAICLVDFVTAYSTTNGTFTIQWNASGIFTLDLTP